MHTLRIEHKISDFASWQAAFDRDPAGRPGAGVVRHRVLRPVDDPQYVMIDLDFSSEREAEAFLDRMHVVWGSRRDAPALVGAPAGRVVAVVDVQEYAAQTPTGLEPPGVTLLAGGRRGELA
jgi:hypothetical protein